MKELKRLAEKFGCTVEDDKSDTMIYIHAPEGKAWEEGELTSLVECYGSCGSYLPEWRNNAIKELKERLEIYGKPEFDSLD